MRKFVATLVASILVFAAIITPTFASTTGEATPKPFIPKQLSKANLGGGSYAEVVNASMMPSDSGNVVTIGIKYHNQGSTDLNLLDYWLRVKNAAKSNDKYSVQVIPDDANITKIPAHSDTVVTYYSKVGADFKISNLIVEMIEWDFSISSFERILGSIKLGSDAFVVPADHTYSVQWSGMSINTSVSKAVISKNEKYYNTTLIYNIQNNGKSSVTLPSMQYYILTSEGILYQLQATGDNNQKIDPMTDKDITLRGNIPVAVKQDGWKLVATIAASDGKVVLPIASYNLPKPSTETGSDFLKEYTFTTLNGLYYVKVNQVTRSPLDDQDIITANLSITNKGKESLPVPDLAGKFVLDGSIDLNASVIQPNQVLAIGPGKTLQVQMYAEIPYTYEFTKLKLVLQQKVTDNDKENLLEITGSDVFSALPVLPLNDLYSIDNVGNRSTYQLKAIKEYNSITSKILTAQIVVSNQEKRSAGLISFIGFFETADGNVFPAAISEIKDKMIPGGKALLEVSTTMPVQYDTKDATLVLGEAVSPADGKEAQANTAYVNPIKVTLGAQKEAQEGLKEIDAFPYTLSFEKVRSQIIYGEDKIQISFNYQLDKDSLVVSNGKDKKIVIEIKDETNNISFMNAYAIEGTDKATSLQLGSNSGMFTAVDNDLVFKIKAMNNDFTFNVYEEISPGFLNLLATQKIRWFSTSQ